MVEATPLFLFTSFALLATGLAALTLGSTGEVGNHPVPDAVLLTVVINILSAGVYWEISGEKSCPKRNALLMSYKYSLVWPLTVLQFASVLGSAWGYYMVWPSCVMAFFAAVAGGVALAEREYQSMQWVLSFSAHFILLALYYGAAGLAYSKLAYSRDDLTHFHPLPTGLVRDFNGQVMAFAWGWVLMPVALLMPTRELRSMLLAVMDLYTQVAFAISVIIAFNGVDPYPNTDGFPNTMW
jgi:hypothetical protein